MVEDVPVMVVAMVIAVISMTLFAGGIGAFVEKHPSMKILALSFLLLLVELLNLRFRSKAKQSAA